MSYNFLVVDSQPLFAHSVVTVLSQIEKTTCVRTALTLHEALEQLVNWPFASMVVLSDSLPDATRERAIGKLRAIHPRLFILVLGDTQDLAAVRSCYRARASGFLSRRVNSQELAFGVRQLLSGKAVWPSLDAHPDTRSSSTDDAAAPGMVSFPTSVLTKRQREVFELTYMGLKSKVVALQLGLTESAVKGHLARIYKLLNVTSRAEAVIAVRALMAADPKRSLMERPPADAPFRTGPPSRGFTLIELLVVVAIIALLASYVGPRFFTQVAKSEREVARAQIDAFGKALDSYRLDVGQYPATEAGLSALINRPGSEPRWRGPYLQKSPPVDPWGRPYQYVSPGTHGEFDLYSHGKDGRPGGSNDDADITNWN